MGQAHYQFFTFATPFLFTYNKFDTNFVEKQRDLDRMTGKPILEQKAVKNKFGFP